MNNYCVCCNKEVELPEGTQVCYNCMDIAQDDRRVLAQITIEEIDHEIKQTTNHLKDLILRRTIFEKAIR